MHVYFSQFLVIPFPTCERFLWMTPYRVRSFNVLVKYKIEKRTKIGDISAFSKRDKPSPILKSEGPFSPIPVNDVPESNYIRFSKFGVETHSRKYFITHMLAI